MRFHDTFVAASQRYSLGVETDSGVHYLSIPVTTGIVDYKEYYALSPDEHVALSSDHDAAVVFAGNAVGAITTIACCSGRAGTGGARLSRRARRGSRVLAGRATGRAEPSDISSDEGHDLISAGCAGMPTWYPASTAVQSERICLPRRSHRVHRR